MVAVGISLANKLGQRAQHAVKIVTQTLARASTVLRMLPHARADLSSFNSIPCNGSLSGALTTSMIDMTEDVASVVRVMSNPCRDYVTRGTNTHG